MVRVSFLAGKSHASQTRHSTGDSLWLAEWRLHVSFQGQLIGGFLQVHPLYQKSPSRRKAYLRMVSGASCPGRLPRLGFFYTCEDLPFSSFSLRLSCCSKVRPESSVGIRPAPASQSGSCETSEQLEGATHVSSNPKCTPCKVLSTGICEPLELWRQRFACYEQCDPTLHGICALRYEWYHIRNIVI